MDQLQIQGEDVDNSEIAIETFISPPEELTVDLIDLSITEEEVFNSIIELLRSQDQLENQLENQPQEEEEEPIQLPTFAQTLEAIRVLKLSTLSQTVDSLSLIKILEKYEKIVNASRLTGQQQQEITSYFQ